MYAKILNQKLIKKKQTKLVIRISQQSKVQKLKI
jgi:hypothetical protein